MNNDLSANIQLNEQEDDAAKSLAPSFDNFAAPLVLYPARNSGIDALNNRFKIVMPLVCIDLGVQQFVLHWHWSLIVAQLILFSLIYLWVRRKYARAVTPILDIRSDGLEIHSLHCDMFIPWAEIKEVRAFRFIVSHVGIEPYDLKKTLARGTVHTQVAGCLNAACVPFYKCIGIWVAPLFLLESELPLAAKDVADQINLRRTDALKLDAAGD